MFASATLKLIGPGIWLYTSNGGEEDTDGGVVEIGLGSGLLYSVQDNTIANSSKQTQQTLTAQDLRSVPPECGHRYGQFG